jgi:hypothetical protein
MSDALFQNISTVQNETQPKPNTIAAATTIAPSNFLTFVSGTTDVGTITAPVTGAHLLTLIFTDASPGDLLTTGNILVGSTTVAQNVPILLFYDPNQAAYYLK